MHLHMEYMIPTLASITFTVYIIKSIMDDWKK
ncbi:hypothetical protein NBRC113063_00199 [Apilactobacillus micheneri]|nr:hypothetical protein NBRC113063_00199 [Apilactobacillus micheneri]